jgi:hypothetical protein
LVTLSTRNLKNGIIGLILATSLVACDAPVTEDKTDKTDKTDRRDKISIGMTRQEVIAQLGTPNRTTVQKGVEYLFYEPTHGNGESGARANDFMVRLRNEKVDLSGEVGDFGE